MSNEQYVLSYDLGTQSLRVLVFNKDGEIVAEVKRNYEQPYFSRENGYAEQLPEFYWNNICDATKELKEKFHDIWLNIRALSVTTCRDVVTCLDKNNNPLRPFILYLDQRRVQNLDENFSPLKISGLKFIGMWDIASSQYAASFCNWIKKYEPQIWEKTEKFVMLSTYIHLKLLGEVTDSYAAQVGHVPFDYKKKQWQGKHSLTGFVFEAKADKMVDKLHNPCDVMGVISKEIADETGLPEGIKVVASGADKACETLAVGCEGDDVAAISLGTSASIEITTDKYIEPMKFLPAYSSIYADKYNPEVLIFRGFWMISWFKKEFGLAECQEACDKHCIPEKILDNKMQQIPVGCDGLVLQPYWAPGVNHPMSKGTMIGFSDTHTRMHVYRAIIEGIGFALYDAMLKMEKRSGYKIKKIAISGGGSNSKVVCQLLSDLFGLPVYKVQTYETSALGAAMASFTGIGLYNNLSDAVKCMSHVSEQYEPNLANHAKYCEIFTKVYKRIYRKNRKTFKNIRTLKIK